MIISISSDNKMKHHIQYPHLHNCYFILLKIKGIMDRWSTKSLDQETGVKRSRWARLGKVSSNYHDRMNV